MTIFLQSLLSGVLIGGAYALIGVGLTIIFGVMRIINFAHGDLVMLGMYASFFLFTLGNVDPFVSIVFVFPLLFLFGAILQKTVINQVLNALPQNQILLTIGIGLILSNTMMLLFTSDYRIISTTYSSGSFRLGEISVSTPLLLSFVITAAVTAALYWFLLKTDTGQAIRATAQDRDAAQLMGVNVKRMSILATGIGAGLAARGRLPHLADLLHLPAGGSALHPEGLRHRGAGRHGQRHGGHGGRHHHRRHRVAGRRLHQLGAEGPGGLRPLPAHPPLQACRPLRKVPGLAAMLAKPRNRGLAALPTIAGVVAVVLLAVFPKFVESPYAIHMMVLFFLAVIMGEAWNLIGGYGGQYSVGHAAYFGIGAYTVIILLQSKGVAPWWGLLPALLLAVLVAAIVGSITFRLRGPYFVLASIAVAEIFRLTALNWKAMTNGAEGILLSGIPPLVIGGRAW